MQAKDIMSTNLVTVEPGATIREVAAALIEHRISGVPVVDKAGRLLGIVSEGDLMRKELTPRLPDAVNILGAIIYYHGVARYREDFKKLMAGTACEIMTKKVVSVSEDAEIEFVGKCMLEHGIKRVPVLRDGRLVGLISRADLIKALL